jgi:HAD superfamily hydrolase (TIGR01484 family)
MTESKPIQLLVFDIDGVLTGGETKALDHHFLEQLASMNRIARQSSTCPAVTLCSGRAAPYVELMVQAIDGHLPAVFENGAGLYIPTSYSFLPRIGLENGFNLQAVRQRLQENLVDTGFAFFQPGKEYTLTLFASDPTDTDRLQVEALNALGSLHEGVNFVRSPSCLNLLPDGVDKGSGIQFLAEKTDIDPANMLGVGDSDIDLPFLSRVGYSAAPFNANPAVKSLVQYVSEKLYTEGVLDILDYFGISC